MKLFKKLLAVTLAAVLALTVLTACDAGDVSEIPSNATEARIYQYLNDHAAEYQDAVLPTLYYSKDLSNVAYQRLTLWIRYNVNNNDTKNKMTKDEYDDAVKKLEADCREKYGYEVSEIVDEKCQMITTSTPYKAADFKPLYDMSNAYRNATKVAVARIENKAEDGGDGKTYTLIQCYREVK